jgi:hypothetical protein
MIQDEETREAIYRMIRNDPDSNGIITIPGSERYLPTQEAFGILENIIRNRDAKCELNTAVSKLSGVTQRIMDASKFRLCIPIEVLKNSADIALALSRLGMLNTYTRRGGRIPFELVVTGVTREDIDIINSLKDKDIRIALNLPENLTVTIITEAEIQKRAQWMNIDGTNPQIRAEIVKQLSLESQELTEAEYMAIATDAVDDKDKETLLKQLKKELEDNISIRVLVKPETGRNMFSLSNIIDDWLKDIQEGHKSTIRIILPTLVSPAEMIEKLDEAIRNAWKVLAAA